MHYVSLLLPAPNIPTMDLSANISSAAAKIAERHHGIKHVPGLVSASRDFTPSLKARCSSWSPPTTEAASPHQCCGSHGATNGSNTVIAPPMNCTKPIITNSVIKRAAVM